jgi:hypothetical protein
VSCPADTVPREVLRRNSHVAMRMIDDATMTGPRLLSTLAKDLQQLRPFMDYLCAALDLEFCVEPSNPSRFAAMRHDSVNTPPYSR